MGRFDGELIDENDNRVLIENKDLSLDEVIALDKIRIPRLRSALLSNKSVAR
jgi:hypothetical protein